MFAPLTVLVLLIASVELSVASVILEDVAYIQLKDSAGGLSINSSTANKLAFDSATNVLYVIAKEPGRLTAYTLQNNGSPTLLTEHVFNTGVEGQPLDVEFCRPSDVSEVPRVAISFSAPSSASTVGLVRFYHALSFSQTSLDLIQTAALGSESVDIEFAGCNILVSANRGRPVMNAGQWVDPTGSMTQLVINTDFTAIQTIDITFDSVFTGSGSSELIQSLQENNFRFSSPRRDPDGNLLSIMQDLEPEDVQIHPSLPTAYVSMPKNNAIARINLNSGALTGIFALGNRSWEFYNMDPTDRPIGSDIELGSYKVSSLMQAGKMTWLARGGEDYLLTLDTGRLTENNVYDYHDFERAEVLATNGNFDISDQTLTNQLQNQSSLGRLFVSRVDGLRDTDGRIVSVMTFGGRGISIRDPSTMRPVTEVVDDLEHVSKEYFHHVFNTQYSSDASTPMSDKRATSTREGPNLGAVAAGELGQRTVVFLGSSSSGMIYVYQLSPATSSPQPAFQSIHRAGSQSSSWGQAYTAGQMGNAGITDMMYLQDVDLTPVLVVASATSNSLAIYRVTDGTFRQHQ